jgi:hypothetical protein
MKYFKVSTAMVRIWELEKQLGLPKGDAILSLKRVNARAAELEAMAAKVTPAQKPAPTQPAPARPAAASATITANGTSTRAQLEAIVGICSPLSAREIRASWTDAELMLEAERAAYQAYVTFPGRRSDAELSAEFWRKHANANELTGLSRVFRADRQTAVNKILAGK